MTFIGLGHYNPFLADSLLNARGRTFAAQSAVVMRSFNETLRTVYTASSITYANVALAFGDYSGATSHLSNEFGASGGAAQSCTLTWMCAAPPFGPNLHPTDAGNQVIADTITALLPSHF